jgi:polyisoprenoid-binding protein YceI
MRLHHALHTFAVAALPVVALQALPSAQVAPLAMDTARVTISGTSNIHSYTAWTDTVRITRVKFARPVSGGFWDGLVQPGALQQFEVAVPVAMLTSRDPGLDKNMHRALRMEANRDITFRLAQLERDTDGGLLAVGALRIAGVEREVVLRLRTERRDDAFAVKGQITLLMTDYGIEPPTAMLGMLKTDPKVKVTFEAVLSVPST